MTAGSGHGDVTATEMLGVLASQEVEVGPGLRHVELFTPAGLLTLLWHGPGDADRAVVACGGAMGGLLGPASGLYQDLGVALARRGVATVRVGYRVPNDIGACTHDVAAAVEMVAAAGAARVVTVGHSFGGAVAVRAAVAMPELVVGVVTLATQSGGCEVAAGVGNRPLLLLHGDADEILPPESSFMVQLLAGTGEVVVLPGSGHLLTPAAEVLREGLEGWITAVLDGGRPAWRDSAAGEPPPGADDKEEL